MDVLHRALHWGFRIFATRVFEQFRMYYRYVQTEAKNGDNDSQVIYERLKPLFARTRSQMAADAKEDLEMEIDVVKQIVKDSSNRIKTLLKKEKELKKEINKDIAEQDAMLDN